MLLAMGIAAFLCVGLGVYYQPLYDLLPFSVHYEPYTGAHVVGQLQLLMFGAFAFTLLILSGYYVPEVKSRNLDTDWIYRKLGRLVSRVLDKGLNSLNRLSDGILIGFVKRASRFFQAITTNFALFFSVNFWLIQGYRKQHLNYKKKKLYKDMNHGTLPIGIGTAVAVTFVLIIFILS